MIDVAELQRAAKAVVGCWNDGQPLASVATNINALKAALSQTLPAPGEVEDVRKRAQSIWDKRWFCIEGEWSPDEEPIETDEPRRFAEIAIAALTPTLATVAAANDEGVALLLAQAEFLCDRLDELDWCEDLDAVANGYSAHVDPALSRLKSTIRLLSQGVGK